LKRRLIIFIIFLINYISFAQVKVDSSDITAQSYDLDLIEFLPESNVFSNRFYKLLNTYDINTSLNYNKNINRFSVSINEKFNSTLVKTYEKNIKDAQYFNFNFNYLFLPNLEIGINGKNNILSDSRKIGINEASITNFSFYGKSNFLNKITIASNLGYSINRQIGENDKGYIYGFEELLNNFNLSDITFFSLAQFRNEDISPRKNTLRNFYLSTKNTFTDDILNTIEFSFNQSRNDFYFNADSITSNEFNIKNNIQNRIETKYFFSERLENIKMANKLNLSFGGNVLWRIIDRNTKYKSLKINSPSIFDMQIKELRYELETNIQYSSKKMNANLRTYYSERDEKNIAINLEGSNKIFFDERSRAEGQKNNHSQRITLSFSSNIKISQKDEINFIGMQNKLKYDTPSKENYDDRDEMLSIIGIQYNRFVNPFLFMFIGLEGNINKLVYISSKRSANNYTNRVLKLNTGGNYSGKNFSSYNKFEVSANYTIYKFEDINPNYKSYSFRQFSMTDSSSLKLNTKLKLHFSGYIKISEQADLKWKEFTIKPNRFLREIFILPKLIYYLNNSSYSIGLRHFSLTTFNYQGKDKVKDNYFSSIGPFFQINYFITDRIILDINGWYEFITLQNGNNETTVFNFTLNWIL